MDIMNNPEMRELLAQVDERNAILHERTANALRNSAAKLRGERRYVTRNVGRAAGRFVPAPEKAKFYARFA